MQVQKRKWMINRFPIAAIVYYGIAKKAGYDEETARALGYASALFFAIVKGGNFKPKKKPQTGTNKGTQKDDKKVKKTDKPQPDLKLYDMKFYSQLVDGKKLPVIGGKVITSKDFNKEIERKFGELADKILVHAKKYVEKFEDIEQTFPIYEAVRDLWRTPEFFNQIKEVRE